MISELYFTDNRFAMFSIQHFFTLLLVGIFIYRFIYLSVEHRKEIHTILFALAIFQQLLLYSWYFASDQFNVMDALPLYPCRILQLLNGVLLIIDSEKLYEVLYLLGIPSAFIALIVADTGGHGLPSAMFVQFFLGHSLMIIIPLYVGKKRHYIVHQETISLVAKIMGVYFIIIKLLNIRLGSNYGYLSMPPGDYVIKGFVFNVIYLLGYYLLYLTLVKFWFKLSKILSLKLAKGKLTYEIE